jgi:hyperosmotically inducible protein
MQGGMNNELWLSRADEVGPQVDLQTRIWEELRHEQESETADVHVRVENFEVTLGGSVPSYRTRLAVQQAAERISGIRAVSNELAVLIPAADRRLDNTLAAAVVNALEWDVRVPHVKLTARVVDGWVTLDGSVARQVERTAAEETVSHLTGIRGITNRIVVDPPRTPANFQSLAEAAVQHLELHGCRIALETHGRTVALHGRVRSLADRAAAERAVWEVPGVAAVEDLLTIR